MPLLYEADQKLATTMRQVTSNPVAADRHAPPDREIDHSGGGGRVGVGAPRAAPCHRGQSGHIRICLKWAARAYHLLYYCDYPAGD